MATILVVDDNALNRSVLTTLLAYRGHRMVEAADGHEAIERTLVERPDLVITDILMPNMDGYQLVQKLKALGDRKPQQLSFTARRTSKKKHKLSPRLVSLEGDLQARGAGTHSESS